MSMYQQAMCFPQNDFGFDKPPFSFGISEKIRFDIAFAAKNGILYVDFYGNLRIEPFLFIYTCVVNLIKEVSSFEEIYCRGW